MFARLISLLLVASILAPTAAPAAGEMPELRVLGANGRLNVEGLSTYLDNGRKWDARLTEAIDAAERQIAAGETDPYVYALTARLYLVGAQFAGPQSLDLGDVVLKKGLALAPDYASLRELSVSYALRRNCPQCAETIAQEMQQRLPDDPLTHRVLGRLAQESRMHGEAVEHLRVATRAGREFNSAWTYQMLAKSLSGIGQTDEAVAAWKQAAELAPFDAMALGNYATALHNYKGDFDQAARLADRVLESTRYQNILNIRALAEWGRWARAYERSPRSEQTAKLLASAQTLMPDFVRAFQYSCEWPGSRPIVMAMLQSKLVSEGEIDQPNNYDATCLRNAVTNKDVDLIELLLRMGAMVDPVDGQGRTPLFYAADQDDLASIRVLLRSGADVNHAAPEGTALHRAVALASFPIMEALLAADADPNVPDQHGRPAFFEGPQSTTAARMLIEQGIDVDLADDSGMRILDYIVRTDPEKSPQIWLATLYLDAGADPFARAGELPTPYEVAQERKLEELLALFEKYRRDKPRAAN